MKGIGESRLHVGPAFWLALPCAALGCGRIGFDVQDPMDARADVAVAIRTDAPVGLPDFAAAGLLGDATSPIEVVSPDAAGRVVVDGPAASGVDQSVDARVVVGDVMADVMADAPIPIDRGGDLLVDVVCTMPSACGSGGGNLVGHWRLDETMGQTANDQTGNANHGMLRNFLLPGWTVGKTGGGLKFDGVDDWIRVPRSPSIEGLVTANQFSITAWVNRSTNGGPSIYATIMSQQYQTTTSEHFGLSFKDNTNLVLHVENQTAGPSGSDTCLDPNPGPIGGWAHVAGTWDGATMKVYVNGAVVCSKATSRTVTTDSTPIVIGGNANTGNADDVTENFVGTLDDVLLYKRALTASEIAQLATGAVPPAN